MKITINNVYQHKYVTNRYTSSQTNRCFELCFQKWIINPTGSMCGMQSNALLKSTSIDTETETQSRWQYIVQHKK